MKGKKDYQLRTQKVGDSGHSDIFRAPDLGTELLVLPLPQLPPRLLPLTNWHVVYQWQGVAMMGLTWDISNFLKERNRDEQVS